MLQVLDPPAVRRWSRLSAEALGRARAEIDALNVFPVPDGDTGTNLHLTMLSAAEAIEALPDDAGNEITWQTLAYGALVGARGNSGVIVSQALRGLAEVLRDAEGGGDDLRRALVNAADLARQAVARPVEGTVLSVLTAVAAAVRDLTADLAGVARTAAREAGRAVRRTPGQLGVLARNGVVDAGGAGLAIILESLAAVVTDSYTGHFDIPAPTATEQLGDPAHTGVIGPDRAAVSAPGREGVGSPDGAGVRAPGREGVSGPDGAGARGSGHVGVRGSGREGGSGPDGAGVRAPDHAGVSDSGGGEGFGYEVMYLLDAGDAAVARLREDLDGLGDSLVVVGGDGLWNVHVHVDDAGAAIEAALRVGRPYRIKVTYLVARERTHRAGTARGVVAVAAGGGLAGLFEQAGAVVVRREPGASVSLAEVIAAIREAGEEVVVLPNDAAVREVAVAAAEVAREHGLVVSVLPTKASVQGLAALAVHDPLRRFDDDVVAMTDAAGHTRHGHVWVADREAMTSAGLCRPGDVLGVVDGDVALIGTALAGTAIEVADRMVAASSELVTLVSGSGGQDALVHALRGHLTTARPDLDVVVIEGGQGGYPLLIGVE
ncbi:DAK2 domain-containing protein [Streptosporangium soli]|nr:DAK2 domain-containing protein [Streptosporangium sp. KLBMP 9127]